MNNEAPGHRPFYKYVSADATFAILQNRTVRYSSPVTFNDPFDIQSGLHFDFDLQTLHGKLLDCLETLASAPQDPPVDPHTAWGKLVHEARSRYTTCGFPRNSWAQTTAGVFQQLVQLIEKTQREYQAYWWNTLLPGVRVFCVSEERDNLLMWAHYAKDHTGAVLEFWSLPDEDNALSVARRVNYVDAPPPFLNESELIDGMTSIGQFDLTKVYRRYAYFKSSQWSYEREWRVWYPLAHEGHHDYVPVRPSEFRTMYLGCRAHPAFVAEATSLARSAFPGIRIFRAVRSEKTYSLAYTAI